FNRRRRHPDFVGIPPRTAARFEHKFVSAPMAEIGRVRNPDVSAQGRHRPMNQRPASVNSAWQESGILIVRGHDNAEAFESAEVFRESEGDTGATARIRGV